MFAENTDYEILTPAGWKDFRGITSVDNKVTYTITVSSGKTVSATANHYFFICNQKIQLKDLVIGDCIDTVHGQEKIISIIESGATSVYDIVEVDDEYHRFVVGNHFITKNCDEFGFVRPTIATEFWTSISPTLATGGKAIITSTPNSDEDQFALLWKGANKCFDEFGNPTPIGQNGFKAYRSFWNEHPDRDETWANQQRAALGVDRFRREMDCEFIIADETLIAPTILIDLEGRDPLYKTGEVRWYKKPEAGKIYCVGLDPSLGTGGDPAAIQVFEANTTEQVAEWRHNKSDIPTQIRILADIIRHINDIVKDPKSVYFSVENNTIGEAALISIAEYGEENIQGYFLSEPGGGGSRRYRKGFNTSNKPKLAACAKLKHLLESSRMKIGSKSLVSELKNFVAFGAGYAAKPGETDDLIMAALLVVRMLQLLQSYHSDLNEQMRDHQDTMVEPLPFIMTM